MTKSEVLEKLKGFKYVQTLAPNKTIVKFDNGRVFQSYDSTICIILDGQTYLTREWNYSKTTGKYRNIFLGENLKATELQIKKCEYKLLL